MKPSTRLTPPRVKDQDAYSGQHALIERAMVLEERRRVILALLVVNLGVLPGNKLSAAQKRLASHMENDNLIQWVAPTAGKSWSRDYQTLKLTKAGLALFKANAERSKLVSPTNS